MTASTTPLFKKIYRVLKKDILSGEYGQGALLPSEKGLMIEHETSRGTVREALRLLHNDNLVRPIKGRGWQVYQQKTAEEPVQTKRILVARQNHDGVMALMLEGMRKAFQGKNVELISRSIPMLKNESNLDKLKAIVEAEGDLDGFIFFENNYMPDNIVHYLADFGKPVINAGLNEHMPFDTVSIDYAWGSRTLVRRLHEMGHRHIVYMGNKHLHREVPSFITRLDGYIDGMADFDLEPDVMLFDHGDIITNPNIYPVFEKLLDTPDKNGIKPTCFFDGGSINFFHIASILIRMGYKIPEDISLCGHGSGEVNQEYGCFDFSSRFGIRETWMPLGQAAAGRLLARFAFEGLRTTLTLIPPEIVEGDSVSPVKTPPGR